MKKHYILYLIILITIGCKNRYFILGKDIYDTIPLNTELTKELVDKSSQFFLTSDYFIVLFDNSDSLYDSEHYALYFNKHLKLTHAKYISYHGIFIQNGELKSYKESFYDKRSKTLKNDYPSNFNITSIECTNREGGYKRKILNDVKSYINDKNELYFKFEVSTGADTYYNNKDELLSDFESKITETIHMNTIMFNDSEVYTISCDQDKYGLKNDTYFISSNQIDTIKQNIINYVVKYFKK